MSAGTLYTSLVSGNSYKIRLLAALLDIDLKHEEIDLLNNQQNSPEFLKINPRGQVPVLVDGDKTLSDSSSILIWLAGKADRKDYWSQDLYEQAQIVDWLSFANSWIQYGVFTPRAILSYGGPFNGLGDNSAWPASSIEVLLQEGTTRAHKSLVALEKRLEGLEWLALDRPTVADVACFPYVALAPMGDVSLEAYGNVRKWIRRVRALEGFVGIEGLDDPLYLRR